MLLSRRELTAAIVAPLVAPVGYWIGLTVFGLARWLRQREEFGLAAPSLSQLVFPLGFALVVGAPIAWATMAVAGLPTWLAVRGGTAAAALGTGRRVALLAAGALIGAVVARLMKPQLGGELFSIPFPPWAGALLGLAVAATFLWMVARG